jgi:hypothetical protein
VTSSRLPSMRTLRLSPANDPLTVIRDCRDPHERGGEAVGRRDRR